MATSAAAYIRGLLSAATPATVATLTEVFDSLGPSALPSASLAPLTLFIHTCAAAAPLPKCVAQRRTNKPHPYMHALAPSPTPVMTACPKRRA